MKQHVLSFRAPTLPAQFLLLLFLFAAGISLLAADNPRERLLMDFGWKFHLGTENTWGTGEVLEKGGRSHGPAAVNFNDSSWRLLDLPHDWVVELPFDRSSNLDHGFKPVGPGYTQNSIGWYRRTFNLPAEDKGRRLWLEFDGVFRDCRVFLNGYFIGHHESGYSGFRYDITDAANCGGKNVLTVRVDASLFEGWFYEGAGIYRHVWLSKTSPVAIAPDGTFVHADFKNNLPVGPAEIHIQTDLANSHTNSATAKVHYQVLDPSGKIVAESHASSVLQPGTTNQLTASARVKSPALWSPDFPQLYKLITLVESSGATVDRTETIFGIRTMAFDSEKGFLLNGKPCVIKGTCNHQDHAGVGSALPDALQNFRIARLKEMGDNAIRTSHNPPTPELLDACDRLGILVMDENRLIGSDAQNLICLGDLVRRDRNHPSVFIWSLCNEEPVQRTPASARVASTMQRLVHRLDPTRSCTAAMNSWSSGRPDGVSLALDVQGFNYVHNGSMDPFHRTNPSRPCIGTEEASAFTTRGIYSNTPVYRSAYDDNKPGYGATAEEWWRYYLDRPWASGAFVWTGFDYRGEPSPYRWPNISSQFGIIDTCGFAKDSFYYYQSWWTDKPVLHLLPHWNWPGKEGQDIDVRCFSNCEEIELFLNGQSLGKQSMPRNSHLQWKVKYAPGTLAARGYTSGKLIAEDKVETTADPAAIKLTPDRATIKADGEDLGIITVAITDAQGRIVPMASNSIHFELTGPARIIGVGNGDPICHEPDVFPPTPAAGQNSTSVSGWRMNRVPDLKSRPETAQNFDDADWTKVDVTAEEGPLNPHEYAVFRTHLRISPEQLAASGAVLTFGMIDDHGWVYVNGQLAGVSHDWSSPALIDIGKFLHAGDNTVAVAVQNDDAAGGLNKGITLDIQDNKSISGDWKRSAFNGLAQIIIRSSRDAGEIHLTARGDGLTETTAIIHAQPATPRPVVP